MSNKKSIFEYYEVYNQIPSGPEKIYGKAIQTVG